MCTASTSAETNFVTLKGLAVDFHGKFQRLITKGRRNTKDGHVLKKKSLFHLLVLEPPVTTVDENRIRRGVR